MLAPGALQEILCADPMKLLQQTTHKVTHTAPANIVAMVACNLFNVEATHRCRNGRAGGYQNKFISEVRGKRSIKNLSLFSQIAALKPLARGAGKVKPR